MKKAVFYARFPVSPNGLPLSLLSAQPDACKEFAEKNGIQIIGTYPDTESFSIRINHTAWSSLKKLKK